MANWKTPKTWEAGEVLTHWKLNTELRDNLKVLRGLQGHFVHLSMGQDFTIQDAEATEIPWDVVDSMVGSEVWTSGDKTQLKAPVPGFYEIKVNCEFDNTSGGERAVGYRRSDSKLIYDLGYFEDAGGANQVNISGGDILQLTTDVYIEVMAYQNFGDTLNVRGGSDRTRVSWRLIGEAT